MSLAKPSPSQLAARATLGGLLTSAVLAVLVAWRYPHHAGSVRLTEVAPALLPLLIALYVSRSQAIRNGKAPVGAVSGLLAGFVGGLLWVFEIAFNNFFPAAISTANARFLVDNGTWAFIVVLIVVTAATAAWREARPVAGFQCGLWAGLVSGILSCLMAELLVLLWMPALLADPLNRAEYAERASHLGAPAMDVYFAWETMAGALGHLVVLGLLMGVLLGAVASLAGLRSRRS